MDVSYVYQVLWQKVRAMIRSGEFEFKGSVVSYHWDDLDEFLFKIFRVKRVFSDYQQDYVRFNELVELGQIDVRWIDSPHAATLLKAKMIKQGHLNGGKESGNKGRDKKRYTGRVTKAAQG